MLSTLRGACLCGNVTYRVVNEFSAFYQCHCRQCQQQSGSAYAANLFTAPENIEWIAGKGDVILYEHPDRSFANAFCKCCGSSVPYLTKSKVSVIVPAGSLLDAPVIQPQANIFVSEQACWFNDGLAAESFKGYPK